MTASVVKEEPPTTTVKSSTEGHPFAQLQSITNGNVVAIRNLNLSSGFDITSPDDVTVSRVMIFVYDEFQSDSGFLLIKRCRVLLSLGIQ